MSLVPLLLSVARRPPDIEIGGSANPYLRRWYVIPRNRWLNIYLHQFMRDDDDRALHDHPWPNCSILLIGGYSEVLFDHAPVHGQALPPLWEEIRSARGRPVFRRARTAHRIELVRDNDANPIPCWSLFLTGPAWRSWGFWCPMGRWVHWKSFTGGPRGETVGAGCGDPAEYARRGKP